MATAILPLSSHINDNKILQENLTYNNANDKYYDSICLYKPKSGEMIKYGLVYKKQTLLGKDLIRMKKCIEANNVKYNFKLTPKKSQIEGLNPNSDDVYVMPIESLMFQGMDDVKMYDIVSEKDLNILNRKISGTKIDELSGFGEGSPVYYNDEYGIAYSTQMDLLEGLGNYYHDDMNSSPVNEGFIYFVSFNKLLMKEILTPFEVVELAEINFLGPSDQGKNQFDKVPGTPFGSAVKKKNTAKVRIDETPAVTNLNLITVVSKDAKNNSLIKKTREVDHNRNIVTPFDSSAQKIVVYEKYVSRVPGPSDIMKHLNAADNKRVRKSLTEEEKNEERENDINQQEIYKNLRTYVGWNHDIDPDDPTNEIFFTPLSKSNCKEGIENLSFFHTRKACYKHFQQNPCLGYKSKEEIMKLLNKHGWIEEEKVDNKTKQTYSIFTYQPAKDSIKNLEVGHHFFNNYQAMLQFISKFPHPLQEDKIFAETLSLNGWTSSSDKKWRIKDKNLGPYTLSDMRKEIWLNPALLFQNMDPALSTDTILSFIIVPEKEAAEIITSPLKSIKPKKTDTNVSSHTSKEPKKKPLNDEEDEVVQNVVQQSALSSSELKLLAREYVHLYKNDDKQGCEKIYVQMLKLMKPADGWTEVSCNWTDQWWKYEKATFPPWTSADANKKKSIKDKTMIPGVDFFWCFEDIANYIDAYGLERNAEALMLVTDYTAEEWNINRRIEEVVKKPDPWRYFNLWKMLESTGWRKFTPKGSAKKLVHYDDNYIPKWNDLDEESFTKNFYTLKLNTDYFSKEQDIIKYLKENGNVAPNMFLQFLDSPQKSESSSPKTPITPHRRVAAILDKDGSYQKERHEKAYHFPAMWESLEDLGFRQVTEKGPLDNTIYIIPTARMKLEENIGKNIENYQKVDVKSLEEGVDYFRSKEQLTTYVTEYYKEFREPKVQMKKNKISKKNESEGIAVAPAKKAGNNNRNNNMESTPKSSSSSSSSSSTLNMSDDELKINILSSEPCDFDALWALLEKKGWKSSLDAKGRTKYIAKWAIYIDEEEDMAENRDFFYDKNEIIKYCRSSANINISTKVSSTSNNTNGRSKKRFNEQLDDLNSSDNNVKKRNMGLDTIEKLTQTPQDSLLKIRYIMKENGKWQDDHSSNKFPSIWGILSKEFGWENLSIFSGHHESSCYFTNSAINKIKEIEGVETVKIVGKNSFSALIENEDYFFSKDDIIKYVDITYCGADPSKYAEESKVGRRRGSVAILANPEINKKAAIKTEEKQSKQKLVNTPKNQKRKKNECYVSPPSTANDSMTSETEEEEYQRMLSEGGMRFGHLWEVLKERGWLSANSTRDVPNNFWVAPWGHRKEGAYLKRYVYDVSKLVRNKDYFVDEKDVIEYFMRYGFEETTDEIRPKMDKAIGKLYNTRHHSIDSDNESDDDDENRGELKLNKVDHLLPAISKIYDDMTKDNPIAKSKMMDEGDQITRLINNQSSPDVNGFVDSNTPSSKRSGFGLDLPLSKKTKATAPIIEKDIKTIEQHIELAKDSLTTDNIMDSHIFERDREFHQLKNCIANALVDRTGRGIYICGSPGGGKTLLVNQVLRNLKPGLGDLDMKEGDYDSDISSKQIYVLRSPIEKNTPFQIIRMTGTSILNANQFYSKLHAELEGDDSTNTSTTSTAKSLEMKSKVFQKFSNSQGKQSPKTPSSMIILVIDEIDRAPLDLIAELFTAAAANYSTLILVGIANDINFPEERLRGLPQSARPEPIIVFETYSIDQLKDILRRRLHNLADEGAINFLAAKSRKSGDVRTLIELASKCVSFAENKLNTDGASMDIALEAPIINQKIVTMALKSLNGDPDIESLHKTSRNGILVLVSLLTSNDNNKTFSMSDMHSAYNTWSDQYHLPEVSGDEFRVRFEELNNNGFLTPENLAGFGSRPMRTQQGKSQQNKYHLKVSALKLLKVLKEKGINMGVKDLENIVNKDKASYDDMGL